MSENTIRVEVRCFSHLRAEFEAEKMTLELPHGASLGDVADRLLEMAGGRLDGLPFRMALNRRFAERSASVAEGDEVALIPPVQGG